MITFIVSAILASITGMFIRAHVLTVTKHIVMGWVRLYSAIVPEDKREGRREEVLSHIHELTSAYQKEGYVPSEIAVRILEDCIKGMTDDIAWCAPSIPGVVADRVKGWENTLRHYRIPNAMIVGVATLGLMNYSFFSSSNNQTIGNLLFINGIGIAMTVLVWKLKHPLARRIFNTWIGIAVVAGIALIAWLTINYRLYEIMTFKILMLAMVSLSPAIIIIDKSWRNRLFRGRWWLIAICWAAVMAGSLAGSMMVAHDVKPLLEMWAAIGMLAIGMLVVYGAIGFAAYILCWLGIRGSAGGLRLVATGIRRLR